MKDFKNMFKDLNNAYKMYQQMSKEINSSNNKHSVKPNYDQSNLSKYGYHHIYPIDLPDRLKAFLFREI